MDGRGFSLSFAARADILALDAEYRRTRYGQTTYGELDDRVERIVPGVKRAGYPTAEDMDAIGDWKSPRARAARKKARRDSEHRDVMDEAFIEHVTRIALATSSTERLRIEALTLLDGVGWPTASAMLHWCAEGGYPVLDWRPLESLGLGVRRMSDCHNFNFWSG
jgi:hypothetical protein